MKCQFRRRIEVNIRKVSMIGAGIMGSGIALTCAKAGYEAIIRDLRKI